MLGAIFGDTIGSVYEFCNIKDTKFPLFSEHSGPTDDSVMSIAVAVLGAIYSVCHYYRADRNKFGLRTVTALNCAMLLLCTVCILSISYLLKFL